jgi:hypothetical protein
MVRTDKESTISLPKLTPDKIESLERPTSPPEIRYQMTLEGYKVAVATKGGRGTVPLETLYPISHESEPDHNLIGRLTNRRPQGDGHLLSHKGVSSFYRHQLRISPTGERALRVIAPDSPFAEQSLLRRELQEWEVNQQYLSLSLLMGSYIFYRLSNQYDRIAAMRLVAPALNFEVTERALTKYDQDASLRGPFKQPKRGYPQMEKDLVKHYPQLTDGMWRAAAAWLKEFQPDPDTAAIMLSTLTTLADHLLELDRSLFWIPDAKAVYTFFEKWGQQTVGMLHGFLLFLNESQLLEKAAWTESSKGALPLVYFDFPISITWKYLWKDEGKLFFDFLKPLINPVIGKQGQQLRKTLLPESRLTLGARVGLMAVQPDGQIDIYKLRTTPPADLSRDLSEQMWWWTQLLNVSAFAELGYITPNWHQQLHKKDRDYRRTRVDAELTNQTAISPAVHAHHLTLGDGGYESSPISLHQKTPQLFSELLWYSQVRTLFQEKGLSGK